MGKLAFGIFLFILSFELQARAQNQLSCSLKKIGLSKIDLDISSDAKKLSEKLSKEGFRCDSPPASYERGVRCRGSLAGYPEPVNIFIPSQYNQESSLPLAVHFHGHNNPSCEKGTSECHFNIKTGNGDYGRFLSNSGTNQLLLVPESLGHDDTYLKAFQRPQDFENLLNEMKKKVGVTAWSSLSLSSHSGGDAVINKIAKWYEAGSAGENLSKLKNVGLFDSLYANREGIAKLPAAMKVKDPSSKFFGSYVVGPGASTVEHMKWLKTQVPASDQWTYRETKTSHMSIMKDGGMEDFFKASCI